MFLNSCLYPFAISLLSILLLFINNSYISQKINLHLKSNATLAILEAQKQQNMALISFVMFLPALWVYASFLSAKGAGDSGLIWVVASIWDSYAQHRYPNQKRWGYLVALIAIAGLWLGGAYGIFLGYQIHH